MKIYRGFLCFIISIILILSFSTFVFAAPVNVLTPKVVIDKVTATAGDTVYIKVSLTDNVAVQAMAFSITYDNKSLTYNRFEKGDLAGYMLADHGTRLNFVDCESKNVTGDIVIGTFVFKVNENVSGGFHEVRIANRQPDKLGENLTGAFACGVDGEIILSPTKIVPTVVNGGVNVPFTHGNCSHVFGAWETAIEADCTREGVAVKTCKNCGKNENKTLDKLPHIFEEKWTVDREATKDILGLMSRHCEKCDAKTDIKTFDFQIAEDNDFLNEIDSTVDKDIINKNEGNGIAESDGVEEKPKVEIDIELSPEELIELRNEEVKLSIFGKIFKYLFGEDNNDGIIDIIITASRKYLSEIVFG